MNENESKKASEVTDAKKNAVLRSLNVCVTDQPTDRHDHLLMCKDAHKKKEKKRKKEETNKHTIK